MTKKSWIIIVGTLFGLCALVPLSKVLLDSGSYALLDDPFSSYRQVVFSAFVGVLFLCLFFLLNIVLVKKLMGFRISFAVFTAGLLGETLSVLFLGKGSDGLSFGLSEIYIFLGLFGVSFWTIKDFSVIFNKNNLRKRWLIEKEQYIFCFYMVLPYLLFSICFYLFSHIFIQMIFSSNTRIAPDTQMEIINRFFTLFSTLVFCFLLTITVYAFYFSNKIYGPVYAFKKHIKDVLFKGESDRPLKLRQGDHFLDLADLAKDIKSHKMNTHQNSNKP